MRALLRHACVLALAVGSASFTAGCGGDEEPSGPHPGGSSASHPTASGTSTGFTPGPPSGGGGGGGFSAGPSFGGGGGGGGGHGRLGGIGGVLHDREARRRAAIERAHRPPGPVRLGSLDDTAQRTADWASASASAHPVTSVDDDQCERLWAQHVATTEAYHTTRHDGLHSAISDSEQRRFLRNCRAQSPAMQQCLDRAYLEAHQDECTEARAQDPSRRAAHRAAEASREPMQF